MSSSFHHKRIIYNRPEGLVSYIHSTYSAVRANILLSSLPYIPAKFMAGVAIIKLLATLIATLIGYGVCRLVKVIYGKLTSPLRDFPGPKSSSLLYGNLKDIQEDVCPRAQFCFIVNLCNRNRFFTRGGFENMGGYSNSKDCLACVQFIFHTYRYLIGLYQVTRLYIADTKALNHVLMNTSDYQKAESSRYLLSRVVGPGALYSVILPCLNTIFCQAFLSSKEMNISIRYRLLC